MTESSRRPLRELGHVSWVASHIEEYHFPSAAQEIKTQLQRAGGASEINYIEMTMAYQQFCDMFCNEPYTYQLGLLDREGLITGSKTHCYLVPWTEEGITYYVPIGFLEEAGMECRRLKETLFTENAAACRELLSQVVEKGEAAQRTLTETYLSGIPDLTDLAGKIRSGRIRLFLAWLLCLVAMYMHPGLRELRKTFHSVQDPGLFLRELWTNGRLVSTVTALGLIFLAVILVINSVGLFRSHVSVLILEDIQMRRAVLYSLGEKLKKRREGLDRIPLSAIKAEPCRPEAEKLLDLAGTEPMVSYPPILKAKSRAVLLRTVMLLTVILLGIALCNC